MIAKKFKMPEALLYETEEIKLAPEGSFTHNKLKNTQYITDRKQFKP